jgi:hypothetical protein
MPPKWRYIRNWPWGIVATIHSSVSNMTHRPVGRLIRYTFASVSAVTHHDARFMRPRVNNVESIR